ncbi:MAG: N-6 DNA methylase [Solirubrobacteraceae bacterium]
MSATSISPGLHALAALLDEQAGRYRELNGARHLGEYLDRARTREDEELLTEPILAALIERVLGFPPDAYFPQLGRSGLKPDFTPIDLVAHRFVLDAKSSTQDLGVHERQIRAYIDQRHLDYGVLFNLRELRVYRRGASGHDPSLSFDVRRLWQVAHGEALDIDEVDRFVRFCGLFGFRAMGLPEKIALVAEAEPWRERAAVDEALQIDVEFLVSQLRSLSRELAEDAAAQHDRLLADLDLNPDHEQRLRLELETLAREIEPSVDVAALPATVAGYRDADGIARRAFSQYLMRVSQLALTRILLYRSWEDAGFVEDCLYDGGFEQVYERMGRNLQRVLDEAFQRGRARYRWLFGEDNNYDWFRPRDEALADVLYALVPFPLARLGADVLGGLYESYVDEIDRDRLGQFYTPRAVVRFMLDRAGFAGPEGVFRIEGDERHERTIFDFATGSGGFLVEAARRVIDDGGLDLSDPRDLREGLRSIVRGFHGCEISPFPYYLTEVNLLLQVSRLLGRLREVGEEPGTFTLGVVHTDSLGARRGSDESFSELHPGQRADAALLASDERYGIVPLDAAKEPRFAEIRKDEAFDLIVGNPPYVSETGNRVLFERLRALPGWQDDHHGKSDYLYYFLAMAVEKLAPGGRLCVITPAGWMNAGNADWLRERIASSLRLDELYLFGSMRLFATEQQERDVRVGMTPPTVESAILLATKEVPAKTHRMRVVLLESETEAAVAITGDPTARVPPREQLLEVMAIRAAGRAGRSKGILVHDVAQSELRSTRPWPIKHAPRDVAARVVAHLQALLDTKSGLVEPLEDQWVVTRGIETGADAYSARINSRLSEATRAQLEFQGVRPGDQILELSPGAEHQSPWREHPEALANSLEPRAILYGAIDADDAVHLVWMGSSDHEIPEITAALERYRPILASRAGFVDSPGRRWWEAHRPRSKTLLRGPKVIALHRTDRGRFALDEAGVWQPSNKSTLVAPRTDGLSVAYLCGLLNSELLDLWYARRGRTPRDIWRDYEPKPMNEMPYRHLPTPEGWKPSPDVTVLADALSAADTTTAVVAAGVIRSAVGTPAGDADAHNAIERLVRAIADNRRALLAFRAVAPELKRAIKNPWRTHGVEVDPAAMLAELPASAVRSVRLDPDLAVKITTDGALGRGRFEDGALVFTHSRRTTARVDGPHDRVALLQDLLGAGRLMPDDLLSVRMPASLGAFSEEIARRQGEIDDLLAVGRELVEVVERLVCALYGVPDALTDLVVESAVTRAGTVAQQEE